MLCRLDWLLEWHEMAGFADYNVLNCTFCNSTVAPYTGACKVELVLHELLAAQWTLLREDVEARWIQIGKA